MAAVWSAQCSRLGVSQPAAALRRQQHQAHPRRPVVQPRAYKGEESSSASPAAAEAQPPPPEGEVIPVQGALASYDDGGFEAGVMPQVDRSALSSEDEAAAETAASYGANSCPLPPACPMPGELEKLEVKSEYLESVDGMVGNYEFAIEEKTGELKAATDDLQRILAELAALEEAASMGRSPAGGGAATASDYCEGAEVSEVE